MQVYRLLAGRASSALNYTLLLFTFCRGGLRPPSVRES